MLRLLVDTSVWLDLAAQRDGQALIVPIRVLKHQGQLELLVPQLVIDEFDRNRPSAEQRVSQRVADRFRELRRDLHEYAVQPRRQEWLDEMTHQVPLVSAMSLQNFNEISELLTVGERLEPGAGEHERVVARALAKQAPCHLAKNSVADALLIELYRRALDVIGPDTLCFVTANYEDFSAFKGDRRLPHADLAELFDGPRSRYLYGVDGLRATLAAEFGEEFTELAEDVHLAHDEPRTLGEILEAEQEFFDKIWHVRHLIRLEHEEAGDAAPPPRDIQDRARAAAAAIVERYGPDNVGPWDDWVWGFVHGKLSALRWVLGSDWDFFDT